MPQRPATFNQLVFVKARGCTEKIEGVGRHRGNQNDRHGEGEFCAQAKPHYGSRIWRFAVRGGDMPRKPP